MIQVEIKEEFRQAVVRQQKRLSLCVEGNFLVGNGLFLSGDLFFKWLSGDNITIVDATSFSHGIYIISYDGSSSKIVK